MTTTKKPSASKTTKPKAPVKSAKSQPVKKSYRTQPSLEQRIAETVELAKKSRRLNQPFSSELFLKIIEEMMTPDPITGVFKSLSAILQMPDMPTRVSFYRWLDIDKTGELRKIYASAGKAAYDNMHDERFRLAYDIADDASMWADEDGNVKPQWNHINIQRAQTAIRAIEWSLARLDSATYGDNIKVDMEMDASPEALEMFATMGAENRQRATEAALAHAKRMAEHQKNTEE